MVAKPTVNIPFNFFINEGFKIVIGVIQYQKEIDITQDLDLTTELLREMITITTIQAQEEINSLITTPKKNKFQLIGIQHKLTSFQMNSTINFLCYNNQFSTFQIKFFKTQKKISILKISLLIIQCNIKLAVTSHLLHFFQHINQTKW